MLPLEREEHVMFLISTLFTLFLLYFSVARKVLFGRYKAYQLVQEAYNTVTKL